MSSFTNSLTIYEIILRIFMAIVIGGMIGYERGQHNRPAGFRTHILVCLGATIMKNYNFSNENNIKIKNVEKNTDGNMIEYTLIMGKQTDILDVMSELSTYSHISQIQIP